MIMRTAFALLLLASTAGVALAQQEEPLAPLQEELFPQEPFQEEPPVEEPPAGDPLAQEPDQQDPGQQDPGQGVTVEDLPAPVAPAGKIKNKVAEFSGLDKITGRTITFDVYIDETVQFGTLQVTPRVCYSRPVTELPKTDAFVEVDEITLERDIRRIFTGWMFADSPGLNAIEHPIYDIWLKDCKMESDVAPPTE
jgi:hypothetical protein